MYTFVWFSGAIWETPSKKTAVILSHLYVIGVKIVLRVFSSIINEGQIFTERIWSNLNEKNFVKS